MQRIDILLQLRLEFLVHGASFAPFTLPLGVTPWVSHTKKLDWVFGILWIWELNYVQDGVGMVQDEASRETVDDELARFTVALDAATQETLVVRSLFKEIEEATDDVLALVDVVLDHFVGEQAGFLVANDDFFGLEASELLDTFINVSRYQVSVAAVHFGVGLLEESNPHFVS